ncbi:MAG: SGNH/GDSL hydrolase family protein [Actinomycetia bacterium]|nr:SGNH/GDSL hydrolase family protein [Actinomycetes bacterium]
MGRARRARKIAATAAYGGGSLAAAAGALGAAGYGLIRAEAKLARHLIGQPFDDSPDDDGTYGFGPGEPLQLLMLGDSTAAGLGTEERNQTIGAILASGIAALSGRPVHLTNVAVVGAQSSDLDLQVVNALDVVPHPDVAVILIGANDVTHRIERATAVRHLEQAVRRLLGTGSHVVVGTCPDLGTIEPVPQPLRALARRWSRDLAAAQTVAVVEAGGVTVSLADMLGAEFQTRPGELFSIDRFHPSPAGYARVAAALLPSVVHELGLWAGESPSTVPAPTSRRDVAPVAVAAGQAAVEPGTEVSGTELGGASRGPRGRWARLLQRRQPDVPTEDGEPEDAEVAAAEDAADGDADGMDADPTDAATDATDAAADADPRDAATNADPTDSKDANTEADSTDDPTDPEPDPSPRVYGR